MTSCYNNDCTNTDTQLDQNQISINPNNDTHENTNLNTNTNTNTNTTNSNATSLFEQWDPISGTLNGESQTSKQYPTKAQLMKNGFGRPSLNHSFVREKHFEDILIHIFKSGYLDNPTEQNLRDCHPLYDHLQKVIKSVKNHDFSQLAEYNTDYATQQSIPQARVKDFLAAAVHYDFHIPSVYRYVGGNYTASYRDVPEILSHIENIVPQHIYDDVKRILTVGTPRIFQAESSRKNFETYREYGNHSSIEKHKDRVKILMNKEERNCYVMVFPCWIARFVPDSHLTPQSILVICGKNDRLAFDGSSKLEWDSVPVNCMTNAANEPDLIYGSCWNRHLIRIHNLRISYPKKEIELFDDDASGAFRHAKHNPDIAPAISFVIGEHLFVPTGQTFGSNTSPANWEPIARARAILARSLHDKSEMLVKKHAKILDAVEFSPPPEQNTQFVQAVADELHKGVFEIDGTRQPPQHNMFVDDNLLAEIHSMMKPAMAASIEALLTLLGFADEEKRKFALSLDKYFKTKCSFEREQLGLLVNTRQMRVSLPASKLKKLIEIAKHWHSHRRSYTLRDIAELMGVLLHAGQVAPWAKFLFISIQDSVRASLRKNSKLQASNLKFKKIKKIIADEHLGPAFKQKADFYKGKLSQDLWNTKHRAFINKSMRAELKMLLDILQQPERFQWSSPIAHLIERNPDYSAWGDSSLYAAGGFSTDLKFWWQINWPKEIQDRNITTIKIRTPESGETISINALEYATLIINYEAATQTIDEISDPSAPEYPVLLNWTDNSAALAWTKKMCKSSNAGKALSRILCGQMINNRLGLNAAHIAGKDNIIADRISRVHTNNSNPDFNLLLQEFPQLRCCRRYHPSAKLVSTICEAMSSALGVDPTKQLPKGLFEAAKVTS
jgi:hypothetical protein